MIDRSAVPGRWPAPELSVLKDADLSRQLIRLVALLAVTGLVTFVLYLYVLPNSEISRAEARIAQLQASKANLVRQNAELERQILEMSELPTVAARARELGMRPASGYLFLKVDGPIASVENDSVTPLPSSPSQLGPSQPGWQDQLNTARQRLIDLFAQGRATVEGRFAGR